MFQILQEVSWGAKLSYSGETGERGLANYSGFLILRQDKRSTKQGNGSLRDMTPVR
jgi:hypothetical protein